MLRGFEKSRLGIHKRQLALIELYLRKDLSRCILFFYNSPYRLPWWYSFRGACRLEKVSQGGLSGHLFDRLLAPLAILSFGLRFAEKRPDEGTLIHSDDWLGESNPGLLIFWPCFDSGGRKCFCYYLLALNHLFNDRCFVFPFILNRGTLFCHVLRLDLDWIKLSRLNKLVSQLEYWCRFWLGFFLIAKD